MKWSMDIVGPLISSGPAQLWFLLVLTDYLTKWIEAEAYHKITSATVTSFIWKNIICRNGLPYEIVTDNGPQFILKIFNEFCEKWKIKIKASSPRYPKSNGHAEAANKTIRNNLKKWLDVKKERWREELYGALWAYHTTPHTTTQETPFSLSYGVEAVIPAEIEVPSQRRKICPEDIELNEGLLIDQLEMIEEQREKAAVHS